MTCSLLNILWQFIRKLFASLSQSCLPYCYWLIGLQPVYFKTVNSCLVSASLWEKNLTLIQYIIYFSVDYNKTIKSDKDEQTSISVQMFISEWPFELFLRCKALKHTHKTKYSLLLRLQYCLIRDADEFCPLNSQNMRIDWFEIKYYVTLD